MLAPLVLGPAHLVIKIQDGRAILLPLRPPDSLCQSARTTSEPRFALWWLRSSCLSFLIHGLLSTPNDGVKVSLNHVPGAINSMIADDVDLRKYVYL